VGSAVEEYRTKAAIGTLHEMVVPVGYFGAANVEDYDSLYSSFLVNAKGKGREYYDRIRLSAESDLCPFCGIGRVETVDHYLPRKHFVQFTIAFENLVPACRDCNSEKLDKVPKNQGELFFHPYYESCCPHRWLIASIDTQTPLSFRFSVTRDNPRTVENQRFENQFYSLKLPKRYATDAAGEYATSKFSLQQVYDQTGRHGLIENLLRTAKSAEQCQYMPWKVAMYRAMATDAWFTSGGFI